MEDDFEVDDILKLIDSVSNDGKPSTTAPKRDLEKINSTEAFTPPISKLIPNQITSETGTIFQIRDSRKKSSEDVQKSWESLARFNRQQSGRIDSESTREASDSSVNRNLLAETYGRRSNVGSAVGRDRVSRENSELKRPGGIYDGDHPPKGRVLEIEIFSTWGDTFYVGMNGIDIFVNDGSMIKFSDVAKIWADPSDINALPEYKDDPRTVENLIDGHNRTQDDMHVWLAPFSSGKSNFIYIEFDSEVCISLIRFWNYNKSRIHSFRGVKDIEMKIDKKTIYKGEIQKAPGVLDGCETYCECLLFTTSEQILSLVAANDPYFSLYEEAEVPESGFLPGDIRPDTRGSMIWSHSDAKMKQKEENTLLDNLLKDMVVASSDGTRPRTSARKDMMPTQNINYSGKFPSLQKITIEFQDTWGDPNFLGLTGIEILDHKFNPISISEDNYEVYPRNINSSADKIFDTVNFTTDGSHMWLIPFSSTQKPSIEITLDSPMVIVGIIIWNYNKSEEDSHRGARKAIISIDDHQLSEDKIVLRKAPGSMSFAFGQFVSFEAVDTNKNSNFIHDFQNVRSSLTRKSLVPQDYEISLLPTGLVFKFVFLSTHGDQYYLGLNGIELWDWRGKKIPIAKTQIQAEPSSVNDLPGASGDPRTLDKLIDGVNNTWEDKHMWLSPYEHGAENKMWIFFDEAVSVSMIKFWNYSKTPSRGVNEFEFYVDDNLVYKGFLKEAPTYAESNRTHGINDFTQTVLFTSDEKIVISERSHIYTVDDDQPVKFINDNKVVKSVLKRPKTTTSMNLT